MSGMAFSRCFGAGICRWSQDKICKGFGKEWLAGSDWLGNSRSVNKHCQAAEEHASQLATARLDRQSAASDSADRRDRSAVQSRIAMMLRIPVGYQDETGFHCGVELVQEAHLVSEPENRFSNPYPF
jgi:hypothetical protein